jgi:hypothetical protein
MYVDGAKIKELIWDWGKERNLPEKSYISKFCEDNSLSYNQWSAYTRGAQNIGIKILEVLYKIFPNINFNWLLKNSPEKYEQAYSLVAEPSASYSFDDVDSVDQLKEILSKLQKKVDQMEVKN